MRPWVLFFTVLFTLGACESPRSARRFTRDETSAVLKRLEVVSLELGEFPIDGASAVIDGDTIRVKGLSSTLRLLAIDAEETFKHDDERAAFAAGWEPYKKAQRGGAPRPVKFATPMGDEGKRFAQAFFEGIDSVRLERDHPGEIRDYYGRYLAYIFAKKDGQWVNFNVEIVRAGLSPYFVKYGRSRRFHAEFLEAQKSAQEAKRGIWAPKTMHYDDYAERLSWWGEREKAITRFEKAMAEDPDKYIALTRWDAILKLEQKVGETVTILGAVGEVKYGEKGPSVVRLSRNRQSDFEVVFFDKDVLLASGVQYKKGEYVQVRGTVTKYRFRDTEKLQLVVSLPGQVLAPSAQLEELLADDKDPKQDTEGD
jgi:endonuclease YncB( thermonuclease family)